MVHFSLVYDSCFHSLIVPARRDADEREGVGDRGSEELAREEEQPTDLRSYGSVLWAWTWAQGRGQAAKYQLIDGHGGGSGGRIPWWALAKSIGTKW